MSGGSCLFGSRARLKSDKCKRLATGFGDFGKGAVLLESRAEVCFSDVGDKVANVESGDGPGEWMVVVVKQTE